ncbi:MAG: amino acid racemase [Lachnospiraceae bacterium]|nr:amino acid racemase [Lachnospiraceae bacterium]
MSEKNDHIIGIVGGMGSYATVDLFKRIIDAAPTKKDWEKPHVIIDNFSTVPSRVRAVLYNEQKDKVVECLASSVRNLMNCGADRIIVGCHTAHIFLPDAIKLVDGAEGCVINIIEAAVRLCVSKGYDKVRLLATEGTVETGIYTDAFSGTKIEIINPDEKGLVDIRTIIEDVKQNLIGKATRELFRSLACADENPVLLGCSELPVIYGNCREAGIVFENEVIDPFQIVIEELVAPPEGGNT